MTSPQPGRGTPMMPLPGGPKRPEKLVLDMFPNPIRGKKPKQPKMEIQPVPRPGSQYMPVNKSKMVNKVYKTY